jgi:hypothetical protein
VCVCGSALHTCSGLCVCPRPAAAIATAAACLRTACVLPACRGGVCAGDPMRLLFERDLTPHPQYAAAYKWLQDVSGCWGCGVHVHEHAHMHVHVHAHVSAARGALCWSAAQSSSRAATLRQRVCLRTLSCPSQVYCADAVVHFGMHGTVEWLPGSPLGNTGACACWGRGGGSPLGNTGACACWGRGGSQRGSVRASQLPSLHSCVVDAAARQRHLCVVRPIASILTPTHNTHTNHARRAPHTHPQASTLAKPRPRRPAPAPCTRPVLERRAVGAAAQRVPVRRQQPQRVHRGQAAGLWDHRLAQRAALRPRG